MKTLIVSRKKQTSKDSLTFYIMPKKMWNQSLSGQFYNIISEHQTKKQARETLKEMTAK